MCFQEDIIYQAAVFLKPLNRSLCVFFSLLLVLYAILIIDAPVIQSLIVRSSYIQAIPVNECFEVRLL